MRYTRECRSEGDLGQGVWQEASTFDKALQTGLEYERQTTALLLRIDLICNDMSIRAARAVHGPPRGDRDED